MTAKIAMLEGLVRDILVDRFPTMDDPVRNAMRYAEAKMPLSKGAKVDPDLEPVRQAVLQEFLDSVVALVRKSAGG
jgi:hypothetical protein